MPEKIEINIKYINDKYCMRIVIQYYFKQEFKLSDDISASREITWNYGKCLKYTINIYKMGVIKVIIIPTFQFVFLNTIAILATS